MKTTKSLFTKNLMVLVLFTVIYSDIAISQNQGWIKKSKLEYGIQINQLLDGSGHGMITDLDLLFKSGNSQVSFGLFTQSKFEKISGASFQFKYYLTDYKYSNLYSHYSLMYHKQNYLTNNLNQIYHPQDYNPNVEYEKFNTISNNIGLGIESSLLKRLYLDFKVGIGGYISFVCGEDERNQNVIAREDKGFSLMASVGISYKIKGKDKKRRFGRF
jgi:hypothetical protein